MSNPTVIKYYVKERFDRLDRIPVDDEFKETLRIITGKKILSEAIIEGFERLGFIFEVTVEPGVK